jgi:hypothetical protein
LDNDSLIKVKHSAFCERCNVAEFNLAITLEHLLGLFRSNDWTILAFDEEKSYLDISNKFFTS